MKRTTPAVLRVFTLFLLLLIAYSCATVPVTGRKQLTLIGNDEIFPMSYDNYQAVLDTSSVARNSQWAQWVKEVGRDIQGAVEAYMAQNNASAQLEGYKWEFTLIEEDVVNAWCMPGGKVAFYTGIMPVCEDKTGVAVVMGHEVAHAIANHGRERMSQGLLQQLGGVALQVAVADKPAETQNLFMSAYGLGTTVGGILPFSRLHESEADKMGLIFMAMAGYDPREAPNFWERMASMSKGQAPPEFLSTHPAHETRISDLKEQVPKAMQYYKKNN